MTRPRAFLRTALCRIPGPHAFGLIPWLMPLLFGLGGARVVTDGSHPPEWLRQIVIADVASWLVQGAVLLLIRRYALRGGGWQDGKAATDPRGLRVPP